LRSTAQRKVNLKKKNLSLSFTNFRSAMLPLILQAGGCLIAAVGLGLAWLPLGIVAAGVALVLFGLAIERGK
jgi:hypothetical protein